MQLKNGSLLQSGKYRIIRVLGQGGFGITYLAEHTMLDKMVAIKEFFPKDYCDRDDTTSTVTLGTRNNSELVTKLKRRFLKEAKNIAKLDHTGIVKIHDIFEENNTAYYVMDYIKGIALSEMVKQSGALSEEKAIHYITKVGEALEYMHSNQMTHFDVKPANIIVADKNDMPVLIDFGLSKQYCQEREETSTLLQAVSSGFSPIELYNPESFSEFSPQTDVYSLAATLYYLLTGIIPPNATCLVSNDFNNIPITSESIVNVIKTSMNSIISNRYQDIVCFTTALKECISSNKSIKIDNYPFVFNKEVEPLVKYKGRYIKTFVNVFDIFGGKFTMISASLIFILIFIIIISCTIETLSDPKIKEYKGIITPICIMDIIHYICNYLLSISIMGWFWGLYKLSLLNKSGYSWAYLSLLTFISLFTIKIITKSFRTNRYLGMFDYTYEGDNLIGIIGCTIFFLAFYFILINTIIKTNKKRWNEIKYLFNNTHKIENFPFYMVTMNITFLLFAPILISY